MSSESAQTNPCIVVQNAQLKNIENLIFFYKSGKICSNLFNYNNNKPFEGRDVDATAFLQGIPSQRLIIPRSPPCVS